MLYSVICDTCQKVVGEYDDFELAEHMAQQHDYQHHDGECHSITHKEIDPYTYEVPDSDIVCQSCNEPDCNKPFPHN